MRRLMPSLAVVAAFAAPALAQDGKTWSFDIGVDHADKYLFRGVILNGDEEILVPHAALAVGNLNLYYYGYFGKIEGSGSDYGETDYGIDYGIPLGDRAKLTLGAVTYLYNGDTERDLGFLDTYEAYGILSFDTFLSPTLSYYRDLDVVEGAYATFALSHEIPLGPRAALTLSGQIGIDFGYNLNEGVASALGLEESSGDLSDGLFGIDLSIQFTDALSGHVLAQRTVALDVLDDLGQEEATIVTAGLGYSF